MTKPSIGPQQVSTSYVDKAIGAEALRYKGSSNTDPADGFEGAFYTKTAPTYGIYLYTSHAWTRQTSPTNEMISLAAYDIMIATNAGSGTVGSYIASGNNFQTALIQNLFAQNITMLAGGAIVTTNYAEDAGGFPTAGYKFPYDGVLRAAGAKLDIAEIRGVKWSGPELIGTTTTITGVGLPALAALSGTDIAIIGATEEILKVERWNGESFAQVGSGLSITGSDAVALAAMTSTDVAYVDNSNEKLEVYRWSGSVFSQLGSSLTITGAGFPALAAINETDVAMVESGTNNLSMYRWSGSVFSLLGSSLTISGSYFPALAAINTTDIAFVDSDNQSLRVYRWSGSAFSQLGTSFTVVGLGVPALAAINSTDVVLIDSGNDSIRIYRWNGTIFSQVGSAGSTGITSGSPALAALNGTDVAYIDSDNALLKNYRFGFALATPYRPWE